MRVGAAVAGLALLVAAPALAAIMSHTDYVFATGPDKDWKTTDQTIVFTVTGAEATPTIHYSLDGGATTYTAETVTATPEGDATFTVNVTTEGSHQFRYWISQEGTTSVVETETPGYVNIDKSAPVTTATANGASLSETTTTAWWAGAVSVTLTATDTASGVAANGTTYWLGSGLNPTTYVEPFEVDREGSTKITYRSVDKVGHEETKRVGYVNIDTEKPSLVINSAPRRASGWYNTDVRVEPIAVDARSGIAALQYREVGSATWLDVVGGSFLLTRVANSGIHTYECQALDKAGNAERREITVNIDAVGPTTAVKARSGRVRQPVRLAYKATDAISPEVKNVVLRIRDSRGKLVKTYRFGDRREVGTWYSVSWRPARAGTFRYSVYCEDLAGNDQRVRGTATIIVRR